MNSKKSVLIFATHNEHKLYEVHRIFQNFIQIKSLHDCGFNEALPETHETLEENAEEKLMAVAATLHQDCFAEDTGLEIQALDGKPGVYSARYAEKHRSPLDNLHLVLEQMKNIKQRNARFRTVIALYLNKKVFKFEGIIDGRITAKPRGNKGFGYDPVFIPDGYDKTFAEIEQDIKHTISHRAIAFNKMLTFLREELN